MGTASGTVHSWSCSALLNHLLSAETVLSVGWTGTGKGQDLLLTELPPTLSGQFCGEYLCFSGMTLVLHSDPEDPALEQWRREGAVEEGMGLEGKMS